MKRILWVALCCWGAAAGAEEAVVFARSEMLPQDELDSLRGGYAMPGGPVMSFGIEQAVYVDGQLVSRQNLNITDIGKAVQEAALQSHAAGAGPIPGTRIGDPQTAGVTSVVRTLLPTTVTVQNSVDGRLIQTMTTLNVAAPSLSAFRASQLSRSIDQATLGAILR